MSVSPSLALSHHGLHSSTPVIVQHRGHGGPSQVEWKAGHLVLKPFTGFCKHSPDTVTWPPGPAGPGPHLPCISARPHGKAAGRALSSSQSPRLSQAKITFSLLCPPKLQGSAPGLRLGVPPRPTSDSADWLDPGLLCCFMCAGCSAPWRLVVICMISLSSPGF